MSDLIYKKNEYNGWKNYETWNVMLWINNDETMYAQVKKIYNERFKYQGVIRPLKTIYEAWILRYDLYKSSTPDGVKWADRKIDLDEVNEHLSEMLGNDE